MLNSRVSPFAWAGPQVARLIHLNLWGYVVSNLVFNMLVPYLNFEDSSIVYLFRGDQCIARFALPMIVLVPFLISVDILKKIVEAAEKGKATFDLPVGFRKYPFILQAAIRHTLIVAIPIAGILLAVPAKQPYGKELVAFMLGMSAAGIAGYTVFRAAARLRSLVQQEQRGDDR